MAHFTSWRRRGVQSLHRFARAASPNANGSHATFEAVAPVSNIDGLGVERADVHAMAIRIR
jgi:hypothetical protein